MGQIFNFNIMDLLDISNLQKQNKMMDETQFWDLIESSIMYSRNKEKQKDFLIDELAKLSPADMIGFELRTYQLRHDHYEPNLWCAIYLIFNGGNHNTFEYFRSFLIYTGKKMFYETVSNPDSLADSWRPKTLWGKRNSTYHLDLQMFWGVAMRAFERRTGKFLKDFIDYKNFGYEEQTPKDIEFNWNANNGASMKAICPRIYQMAWNDEFRNL